MLREIEKRRKKRKTKNETIRFSQRRHEGDAEITEKPC